MMLPERRKIIFPKTGEVIEAEEIGGEEIKNGETFLVDRDHNASIILKPLKPVPKGPWEIKK